MEPATTPYKPLGPAMLLALIVGAMVGVAGLALIAGAVALGLGAAAQFVWTLIAAALGLEVRL
jgi:hypothetical protein